MIVDMLQPYAVVDRDAKMKAHYQTRKWQLKENLKEQNQQFTVVMRWSKLDKNVLWKIPKTKH